MEFTLLFAALTGVGFAWVGLRIWTERLPKRPADILIGASVVGLLFGRLTAMITQGDNPVTHFGDVIIVRGGVATAAATSGFVAYLLWVNRRELGVIDALTPAVLLGLAGWHAGCLWRGACLGTPSDLIWAWAQDGSAISRHPIEIYTAIGLVLVAIAVSTLPWPLWLRFGLGMSGVALVRFVTEPLRPSLAGGPTALYVIGIVSGLSLVAIGRVIERRRQPAPT